MKWPDVFFRQRYWDVVSENTKLRDTITSLVAELHGVNERLSKSESETKDALRRVADVFAVRCGFGEVFNPAGTIPKEQRPEQESVRVSPMSARERQRLQMNDFFERLSTEFASQSAGEGVED